MGFDGVEETIDAPAPIIGQLDEAFGTGGVVVMNRGTTGTGYGLLPRADGGVVVVGVVELAEEVNAVELTAWTAAGTPDPSYGVDGRLELSLTESTWAYGARRLPDGRGLIWGDGFEMDPQADDLMYALLDAGDQPTGPLRHIDVQSDDTAEGVVPRPDGGVAICGVANREQSDQHYLLAFTNADGTLDGTIGENGVLYDDESEGAYDRCWDMELDAQGRLITAGTGDNDLLLTRHLPDGARDPAFGGDGRVLVTAVEGEGYSITSAPDGDLVLVGIDGDAGVIARFDESGTARGTFGEAGIVRYLDETGAAPSDTFHDAFVQSDGKIIVAGIHDADGNSDAELLRFDQAGALDPTFGTGGVVRVDRSSVDTFYALAPAVGGGLFATGETNGTTWLIKVR